MTRIIDHRPRTRDVGIREPGRDDFETAVVRGDAIAANVVSRRWRFSPAGLIAAAIGAVLLVMGLIGLVRGDLVGSINDPLYNVAGFAHTPLLSVLEAGMGAVLLIFGLAGWLPGVLFAGAVMVVAAVVALFETSPLSSNLVIERSYSWLILVLGLITVLSGWALPTVQHSTRRVIGSSAVDTDRPDVILDDRDVTR